MSKDFPVEKYRINNYMNNSDNSTFYGTNNLSISTYFYTIETSPSTCNCIMEGEVQKGHRRFAKSIMLSARGAAQSESVCFSLRYIHAESVSAGVHMRFVS